MNTAREKAYAKINLFLDVTGRRSDGFHEIRSVMQSVSLFDTLTVTLAPAARTSVELTVKDAPFLPTDGTNLVVRAATLFLRQIGREAALRITLEKRIPTGAGLAGGSSDAAATLRVCNRLLQRPLSSGALLRLAAELGSDVPFCLLGKSALCFGRGERMEPITLPPFFAVLAFSGEPVSTPAAYAALDSLYHGFDGSVETGGARAYDTLRTFLGEGRLAGALYNVFDGAVLPTCPRAAHLKERLLSLGAEDALMSGSGSAVFGLFPDIAAARLAEGALRAEGATAFSVSSVG